jgi:hypothetical protein
VRAEPSPCDHRRRWRLGVLDSGLAPTALVVEASRSFVPGDSRVDDTLGHAASCLRALDAALALHGACRHCVRLVCAKVLSPRADAVEPRDVARGLAWLNACDVHLVAAPLSITAPCPALRWASFRAVARGRLVVAAAGRRCATLAFPAAFPGVIAVQGSSGPYPKPDALIEPASDDSRAVMYRVAALLAAAQRTA